MATGTILRTALERLLEVAERAVFRGGSGCRTPALVHARDEEEGDLEPLEHLGDFEPHDVRQQDVEYRQGGLLLARHVERGAAAAGGLHRVAGFLERRGKEGEKLRVVVDDEDPRRSHVPRNVPCGT